MTTWWKENKDKILSLPQRQDSTTDQLKDLILVANKLGLCDATDLIKKDLGNHTSNE